MTRLTKPDTDAPEPTAPAPAPDAPAPAAAAPATADSSSLYEPYPGAGYFHGGRHSPIVHALAQRLVAEGHWTNPQTPGPDWTNGHKQAFAVYQHTLRPKEGGDVTGIPDEVAWDRLQVPRVSPVTNTEN